MLGIRAFHVLRPGNPEIARRIAEIKARLAR
jgi:hypothetical protein